MANRVVAPPLAGISDKAYRILAQSFGCGLTHTEMISDMGLVYGQARTLKMADTAGEKPPVAVQIFGHDPVSMGRGAAVLEKNGAAIIDINMGCPTPKVVKNGEGAALLRDLPRARAMIREVVAAVEVPVTVKMRRGWSDGEDTCLELALAAEEAGVQAITLHPRSREQFFSGRADWNVIKKMKQLLTIPVIGNGDIWKAEDAENMIEQTGCDAVMPGRVTLGNPFIFRECLQLLEHGCLLPPPTLEERVETALLHLQLCCQYKGEKTAAREMRKHLAWYTKGLRGAPRLREKINQTFSLEEMAALIRTLEVRG